MMLWEGLLLLALSKAAQGLDNNSSTSSSLCFHNWEALPALDGYQGKSPLLNVTTPTRLECSYLCLNHIDCMSFSYERSSQRCLVHWRPSPQQGDPLAGMKTFRHPYCRKTCKQGKVPHKCALCIEQVTTTLTYHQAAQRCQDLGGRMFFWERKAQFEAYVDFIFSDFNNHKDMWVGANDEDTEGTFEWYDGSPADIPWNKDLNEPRGGGAEDCVFFGMGNYQMSPTLVVVAPAFQDDRCTARKKFLCRYD